MALTFRGAPSSPSVGNVTSQQVTIPATVVAGDTIFLFATWANTAGSRSGATISSGSTLHDIGTGDYTNGSLSAHAWYVVAGASDAGATFTVTYTAQLKCDLGCAVYSGSTATPLDASLEKNETVSQAAHTTGTITTTNSGDWLLQFLTDKSATATDNWLVPAGVTKRQEGYNTGSAPSILMVDSNGTVAAGTQGGATFTAQVAGVDNPDSKCIMFTIGLAPASSGTGTWAYAYDVKIG